MSRFRLDLFRLSFALFLIAAAVPAAGASLPGASVDPANADGVWISSVPPPPPSSTNGPAIYDPIRDRMIVYGDGGLWALSLSGKPSWTRLETAGTPFGGIGSSAIYDSQRDRMVVFGRSGIPASSECWALTLSGTPTWTQISLSVSGGGGLMGRHGHSAIYDPARDHMVVFGGTNDTGPGPDFVFSETWEFVFDGDCCASAYGLPALGPSARFGHAAFHDPTRDRMVVFGGWSFGGADDVWAFPLPIGPWQQLTPSGIPPAANWEHTAVYDAPRDRMLVFGGTDGQNGSSSELWELEFTPSPAWSQLAPADAPPPRWQHVAVVDPDDQKMVVHGGVDQGLSNDTWTLTLDGAASWTALGLAVNSPPVGLLGHTAVFDPQWGLVLYGGGPTDHVPETFVNTVWTRDGLVPIGTGPGRRANHVAILDPGRRRMIVHGGQSSIGAVLDDVWSLSMLDGRWTSLVPLGSGFVRMGHTAIHDPVRDRLVCFGGWDGAAYHDDVWAFSLATGEFEDLTPVAPGPMARASAVAIYDPVGYRMIVHGGESSGVLSDLWALSLAVTTTWTPLAATGTPPGASDQHTAIYDSYRHRMVVCPNGYPLSVHALSLTGSPSWSQLAPVGSVAGRRSHTAVYSATTDRMIVYGGVNDGRIWSLAWGDAQLDVPHAPANLHLSAPRPNPTTGRVALDLDLPEALPARAMVIDLQGRVVRHIASDLDRARRHTFVWDGRTVAGNPAEAGVYFVRVVWAGGSAVRRVALVP